MNTNVVQTIIEMDKSARAKVGEARQRAEQIKADAKKRCDELIRKDKEQTDSEAKRICDEIKKKSDREIAAAVSEADEKCRCLEEAMKNGAEERLDAAVERIFGGLV